MMGFFMSFLLLLMAIYGFQYVTKEASESNTRAVYTDIANRVARGVLSAVEIGATRAGSGATADTTEILYQQVLLLPVHVHGQQYRVTLSSGEVRVVSEDGALAEGAPTFNLRTGACSPSATICSLGGTFLSSPDGLRIKYEYKASGTSSTCSTTPVNCITIR